MFLNVIDKHAPCTTIKVQNKPSPWITSDIKQSMPSRDRQKKEAMQSNLPEDWTIFERMKNEVNKEVKRVKKSYYQREILNREGNAKAHGEL